MTCPACDGIGHVTVTTRQHHSGEAEVQCRRCEGVGDIDARIEFERRIDAAAKKATTKIFLDMDPVMARQVIRQLLRKVAKEAAQQPEMFGPAQETTDAKNQ